MTEDIETIKNAIFLILAVGIHIVIIYIIFWLYDMYEEKKKNKITRKS